VGVNDDQISPYQARLYGAVIYGHDRARQKAARVVRVLWASRRRLQAENAGLRARIESVQTVCAVVQISERNPNAGIRADWVNYALHPELYPEPEGWHAVKAVADTI
jgi:hypothetical protein